MCKLHKGNQDFYPLASDIVIIKKNDYYQVNPNGNGEKILVTVSGRP